jgi:hypothetical protein
MRLLQRKFLHLAIGLPAPSLPCMALGVADDG